MSRRARWSMVALLLALGGVIYWGSLRQETGPASGTMPAALSGPPRTFKVATYNIHSGFGSDGRYDLERIAADLRGFDIVGLNEVRGALLGEDQAHALAGKLHMSALFLPTEHQWWHDSFGNALLVSIPAGKWVRTPLEGSAGRGMRNVTNAEILARGGTVHVLVTHVDRLTDRQAQLKRIIEQFVSQKGAAILMGDLNTPANDPQLVDLRRKPGVVDCVGEAMGAGLPAENIDWIFVKGLHVRAAGLKPSGASDHPMAWAELEPEGSARFPATGPATKP